jgi:hypothetical protein
VNATRCPVPPIGGGIGAVTRRSPSRGRPELSSGIGAAFQRHGSGRKPSVPTKTWPPRAYTELGGLPDGFHPGRSVGELPMSRRADAVSGMTNTPALGVPEEHGSSVGPAFAVKASACRPICWESR